MDELGKVIVPEFINNPWVEIEPPTETAELMETSVPINKLLFMMVFPYRFTVPETSNV